MEPGDEAMFMAWFINCFIYGILRIWIELKTTGWLCQELMSTAKLCWGFTTSWLRLAL